jgi:carbon storage regulator CsrA
MLVLTRRRTESILIDSDIEIVVTAVHKNQVKLGVIAPRHISVQRKELVDRPDPRLRRRGRVLDFYCYDQLHETIGELR